VVRPSQNLDAIRQNAATRRFEQARVPYPSSVRPTLSVTTFETRAAVAAVLRIGLRPRYRESGGELEDFVVEEGLVVVGGVDYVFAHCKA
jgi:hypothetical protein